MKAVMLSLHPQWCNKIFNGSKTIEVRKSRPSIDMPFKVYVYQTKIKVKKGDSFMVVDALNENLGCGKVIGSFVCDRIEKIEFRALCLPTLSERCEVNRIAKQACLTIDEMRDYLNGDNGYGWHITEPKLFDKPRDITEFALYGRCAEDCDEYDFCARDSEDGRMSCKYFKRTFLKRPPQSWVYCETIDER